MKNRKGIILGENMIENGELIAVKANKFVQEYRVSLTLQEIRIVNYMIANIDSPKYDKEFRKFRFNTKEFCNMIYPDKKIGDAYKWLPKLLEGLAHKGAWKEVPSTENPGKMKKALIHWVERPEFEEGYITIELNPNLAPYLLQLDKSFFKSKFQYTALATSKYTIPLYELLKSWEKAYKKKFELTELREYMDAMDKSKDNVSEFKRRALDPAVNEINEITDLQISYAEIKRGRKVTHIEFNILPKKPVKNVIDQKSAEESLDNDKQMHISDFPETLPDDDPVSRYDDDLVLYAELCNFEFDNKQMRSLVKIAKEKLFERLFEIPSKEQYKRDMLIADYISEKYNDLDTIDIKYSRIGTLRDLLKRG